MLRVSSLLAGLGVLVLAGGCTPEPCTSCISITGTYNETAESTAVNCDDGSFLEQDFPPDAVSLTQSDSSVTASNSVFANLPGVLHSDLSVSFGPVPGIAEPVDGDGNPDPSGTPEPGKLYLEGWFSSVSGQGVLFKGTYMFIADLNGCEVDSPVQWQR